MLYFCIEKEPPQQSGDSVSAFQKEDLYENHTCTKDK